MKTLKRNLILFILLAGGLLAFSQCAKEKINDGIQSQADTKSLNLATTTQNSTCKDNGNGAGHVNGSANGTCTEPGNGLGSGNGTSNGNNGNSGTGNLGTCISSLPSEPLSASEISALTIMREEELLAHDVYTMLFSMYKTPVFNNISLSEMRHTEAIKALLLKYSLTDPAADHIQGVFVNPELQALYISLASQGKISLTSALSVGATIEDLDINDLHNHIAADVDNQDIIFVFGNLEKGSRNHLRAFISLLTDKDVTYSPQYISVEYFNQIISSAQETCSVVCPN
jgi:hypothetical protein